MTHNPFRDPTGSHLPFTEKPPRTASPDGLRPFLGLGPRLLLTTLSPALLPLIFTIVHLIATRSSSDKLAATLKDKVMAACHGLADGAGSLRAIPRYLAMQTNKEVLRATRATVLAVGSLLMDCLTIIEKVIGFIIDMYRSLLLCTIQLIVQATMEFIIAAVDKIKDGIAWIRTAIQALVEKGNDLLQLANRIPGVDIDSMSFSAIDQLEERLIPTSFQESLERLNASVPTLDDFRNLTGQLIAVPFDKLRTEINETRFDIAANLNDSIFPPPSLKQLGAQDSSELQKELCGDLDTSVIDNTAKALYNLGTAGIVALSLIVVAGFAVLAYWQWMEWRAIKASVDIIESNAVNNPWTIVAIVENPMMEQRVQPILDRLNLSPRTRNNLRWLLSYLVHPTCLALLCMSVLGLIVIQVQILALNALERQARSDANSFVSASTAKLVDKLNAVSGNVSQEYAASVNKALASVTSDINDKMFAKWINTTSSQLNETLVEFYDDLETLLNRTLGKTILHNPLNNFMYCVIGSKVDAVEKGIAWIQAHAHVDFPLIPDDVLMLSDDAMEELASPVAAAAVGAPTDSDGGALGQLIDHFERALSAQRTMYAILLGVYGALLLTGLAIFAWHSGLKDKWEQYRAREAAKESSFGNGASLPHGPSPYNTGGSFLDMGETERGSSASLAALASPGMSFLRMQHSPQRVVSPGDVQQQVRRNDDPEGEECLRAEGKGLWVDRAGDYETPAFRGARLGALRDQGGQFVTAPDSPEIMPQRLPHLQPDTAAESGSRPLPPPPRQVTPIEQRDAVDNLPTPVGHTNPFRDIHIPETYDDDSLPRAL